MLSSICFYDFSLGTEGRGEHELLLYRFDALRFFPVCLQPMANNLILCYSMSLESAEGDVGVYFLTSLLHYTIPTRAIVLKICFAIHECVRLAFGKRRFLGILEAKWKVEVF